MIRRKIEEIIQLDFFHGKALLVFGSRQVGKTTALLNLLTKFKDQVLFLNADEADVREQLTETTTTALRLLFGDYKIVFIDEAQRVKGIGLTLKLITDNLTDIQVIATGSSAFDLASQVNEPLTGRKYEYHMHPLSFQEMVNFHGLLEEQRMLTHRMIYGYYPEVVTKDNQAERIIKLIANSYLYKDLLELESIKKPAVLMKLLKALALQVGSEVSNQELSRLIGVDANTIDKYLDLLQKAFVIFPLNAMSGNIRNEIRKGKKYYFYDNGVRNAIISNFQPLINRTDVGALWENFVIAERKKQLNNNQIDVTSYFWRTTQQQEINYIEEINGELFAYELKWNPSKRVNFSKTFLKNYLVKETFLINNKNYHAFFGLLE